MSTTRLTAQKLFATLLTFGSVAAGLAFVGCGASTSGSESGYIDDAGTFSEGGGSAAADLPCDLAKALERCFSCHGTTPLGDAKVSLNSYAALTAASPSMAGMTVAQSAVVRMKDTSKPMPAPPSAAATSAEIDALQKWIDSGMPKGDCGSAPDPFAVPPKCTSGLTEKRGDSAKGAMYPGRACVDCHVKESREAPALWLGGTVYPSAHEPDNCISKITDAPVSVVVVDSTGKTYTLPVSPASGNFYLRKTDAPAFKAPFKTKVVKGDKERVMSTEQSNGDCNACHTQDGATVAPTTLKAPGRILQP